jgi:hypothetical protein
VTFVLCLELYVCLSVKIPLLLYCMLVIFELNSAINDLLLKVRTSDWL